MLRQKSVCLDTDKPRAQKMAHPARTNRNMRSDVEYDQENKHHFIDVTEKPVTRDGKAYEASEKTTSSSKQPSWRSELFFQRIGEMNNKNK